MANAKRAVIDTFYTDMLATGRFDGLEALFTPGYLAQVPAFKGIPSLPAGSEALRARLTRAGAVPHRLVRVLVDGDCAFAHVQYYGETPVAGMDVFRFDDSGRIAEHWNVRQPLHTRGTQGDDRFETDPAYASPPSFDRAWLRGRVQRVLMDMWSKGDAALVPEFYDETYIQHNAEMPGGYQRILEIVTHEIPKFIKATGGPYPIDVHHLVADGDLVGVHHSVFMAGINRDDGKRSTNCEIFRVNAAGRMVEHWDVLQIDGIALPPNGTLF